MFNRVKMELLNIGLKFISVNEKLVRMFLETSPSNINEIVILPATDLVAKKITTKLENKKVNGKVINGSLNGISISVVRSSVGCPNTAIIVEALKLCGVKIILRVDFCGGINLANSSVEVGDILIPNQVYCGDGTTPLYLMKYPELLSKLNAIIFPFSKINASLSDQNVFVVKPDETLKKVVSTNTSQLINNPVKEVDLWTLDALFCETNDFIAELKSLSIQGIDMESSILFLLGALYNIKTISVLAVSDLPGHNKYDIFKTNEIHPNMEKGIDKAINLIINTLPKVKSFRYTLETI